MIVSTSGYLVIEALKNRAVIASVAFCVGAVAAMLVPAVGAAAEWVATALRAMAEFLRVAGG